MENESSQKTENIQEVSVNPASDILDFSDKTKNSETNGDSYPIFYSPRKRAFENLRKSRQERTTSRQEYSPSSRRTSINSFIATWTRRNTRLGKLLIIVVCVLILRLYLSFIIPCTASQVNVHLSKQKKVDHLNL